MLFKEEAERNKWLMATIIATNKGNDGFTGSVNLMLGVLNKVNSVAQYFNEL